MEELTEKFERQKSKLNLISIKGLEKTAFAGQKKGGGEEEIKKIKVISKVQHYVQQGISRVEDIFRESLQMLKLAQLKEEELKNKLAEQEKQNRFWEEANEVIEAKLNEAEERRLDLQKEIRELQSREGKTEELQKQIEEKLICQEIELKQKEEQIDLLRSKMEKFTQSLESVELQKQMVEELGKQNMKELEEVAEKTRLRMCEAERTIFRLESSNQILEEELGNVRKTKEELERELETEAQKPKFKEMGKKGL